MKVSELIAFLQTQPQYLEVVYRCYSELCLLEAKDIEIEEFGVARPDGWVPYQRPDKPSQQYLAFPGN